MKVDTEIYGYMRERDHSKVASALAVVLNALWDGFNWLRGRK